VLTGRTAELMLSTAMGNPMTTAIYEGMCAGNSQSPVRGVAVCYAPAGARTAGGVDLVQRSVSGARHSPGLSGRNGYFSN